MHSASYIEQVPETIENEVMFSDGWGFEALAGAPGSAGAAVAAGAEVWGVAVEAPAAALSAILVFARTNEPGASPARRQPVSVTDLLSD